MSARTKATMKPTIVSHALAPALLLAERLAPARHRYLADHQLSGKPVRPVAMMAEWFAGAARRAVMVPWCSGGA